MNAAIFFIYFLLWFFTTIRYLKKKKNLDSGGILLLSFSGYSFFSLLLIFDTGRGLEFSNKEFAFLPLIYLYIVILISIYPVLRYNQNNVTHIKQIGCFTIDSISWIFLCAATIQIPYNFIHIREGLTTILIDSAGGLDIYRESMAESQYSLGDGTITNLPSIIVNVLTEIVILIVFFNFASKRKKKTTIVLLFLICILPFSQLANSQRGPAVSVILTILVTYFAFNKFYPNKLIKYAKRTAIIVGILIMIPFLAISFSRFDRSEGGVSSSFISYLGQENLNFDLYAFDNNGLRYGDRVFPLVKKILLFDNVPSNFWERRSKYPRLHINDEVFIGYVGDFCLDFGPVLTFLFFFLLSLMIYNTTKLNHGILTFQKILILQFVMVLAIQGGMKLYPFADGAGLKIFSYILTLICLRIEHKFIELNSNAESDGKY